MGHRSQVREKLSLTKGRIIVRGKLHIRGKHKRTDYVLFYKPNLPIAVIEAKDNKHSLGDGMQQALGYAELLQVPFVFHPQLPRGLVKQDYYSDDSGTEFAWHHKPAKQAGMKTYFCDIRAPCQKGGVENTIGRLLRYLPRKTDINKLSEVGFDAIIARYNNTPRKCLDYRTPIEVFSKQLKPLHFKRESTCALSRV